MSYSTFANKKKGLVLIIAGFAGGIVLIVSALFYIQKIKGPVVPAINAIPENVAWFCEIQNTGEFWKEVRGENRIWRALSEFDYFADFTRKADSVNKFIENNELLELFHENPLYVCCTYDQNSEASYMFILNLPDVDYESEIREAILKKYYKKAEITEKKEGNALILEVLSYDNYVLCFAFSDGVFIASENISSIENSLKQINSGKSFAGNEYLKQVMETTGKNVNANIYIDIRFLDNILSEIFNNSLINEKNFLSLTGKWAGLDLIVRKNELLLSGYVNSTATEYLEILKNQKNRRIEMTQVAPFNTIIMLYLGVDNWVKYFQDYNQYLKLNNLENDNVRIINENCQCNIEENLMSWVSGEAALIVTEEFGIDRNYETYAVFRTANVDKTYKLLEEISETASVCIVNDSTPVRQIMYKNLFPSLYGTVFHNIINNYYIILDKYVVFGNSPNSLILFASAYFSGKSLEKNQNYSEFADNIADKSSLLLYVNLHKSVEFLKDYASDNIADNSEEKLNALKNFQAFSLQVVPEKNMLYVSMYLKYNPLYKEENPAVWEFIADTNIVGKPYAIRNTRDSSVSIIAFDINNQMYCIDNLGRLKWKIKLNKNNLSEVYSVSQNGMNPDLLVFNTENNLYLTDFDGRAKQGFPYAFKYPATNGLSVFKSNENNNYRIMFVCDDHYLYSFNQNGNPSSGWKPPKINASVKMPISLIRMLGTDYYIVTDDNGITYFYNQNGNPIFPGKNTEFVKAGNSSYYLFPDGKQSRIITTDRNGHIIRISAKGELESLKLTDFGHDHYFIYEDFNGNTYKDYIFIEKNNLKVFDVNKVNICKLDFPSEISSKPVKVGYRNNTPVFAVVSEQASQIYIFDKSGILPVSEYFKGKSDFSVSSLDKSNTVSIIVSDGKIIYNYRLSGL